MITVYFISSVFSEGVFSLLSIVKASIFAVVAVFVLVILIYYIPIFTYT